MDRESILERLSAQAPALKKCYGLRSLAVFGSMARGDDHEESAVDILASHSKGLRHSIGTWA